MESRLPALADIRDDTRNHGFEGSPYFTKTDAPLLRLVDDWCQAKTYYSEAIQGVLDNPSNAAYIERYHEIVEDVATDPNASEEFFYSADGHEELRIRLNPAHSFEAEISGYMLIKWGLELVPRDRYPSEEDRRRFLLDNISFFLSLAELEIIILINTLCINGRTFR